MSWWLPAAVVAVVIAHLAGGAGVVLYGDEPDQGWWMIAVGVGIAAGLVALAVPTEYELEAERLLVRSGRWSWTIDVGRIERVEYSTDTSAAPAWSPERLRVDYRDAAGHDQTVLISPVDRRAFLAELTAIDTQLQADDNGLVRVRPDPLADLPRIHIDF